MKKKVGTTTWKRQQKILWSALLTIEEMVPRKGRYGEYVVLYTNAGNTVACSPELAHKLCLFEPFEMKGTVNYYNGGMYLKLKDAQLFNRQTYVEVF